MDYSQEELIEVLERLNQWGYYCGGTEAINELVKLGLVTREGVQERAYPGQYGLPTEKGKELLSA